jgi:hypothetical protein
LSCTHPIHQRLQCVLERMFLRRDEWLIEQDSGMWKSVFLTSLHICINRFHVACSAAAVSWSEQSDLVILQGQHLFVWTQTIQQAAWMPIYKLTLIFNGCVYGLLSSLVDVVQFP